MLKDTGSALLKNTHQRKVFCFFLVLAIGLTIVFLPTPSELTRKGQYAIGTTVFAAGLWVTGCLPLPVTALFIPISLTALGVYQDMDVALAGFSNHLIFLFIVGFMLANMLQKYDIDRRIALRIMIWMGLSPRLLILSVMVATAFLSMWVSNTATTAMMAPIALGLLAQVIGRDEIKKSSQPKSAFSNMQVSMLLGTAYGASVGGVGTLIGSPPNALVAAHLEDILGVQITFADWLLIGLPVVLVSLPLVWYMLTFVLFPPEIGNVQKARSQAKEYLRDEGKLAPQGRRVAYIFAVTAGLWVLGGLGFLFEGVLPDFVHTTLFGGTGESLLGVTGHQGLLYYVMVGLAAIPALVLFAQAKWDDLVKIDWGTILLFGGGLSLANSLTDTGATRWLAESVFVTLKDAPVYIILGAVIFFVIWITNITSNTATTAIVAPILVSMGSIFAVSLNLTPATTSIFLSVSAAIAASHAFALPVATPPNAIVFGTGYIKQSHMLVTGSILNILMTVVLTGLITGL